jgi:hypothetical protein
MRSYKGMNYKYKCNGKYFEESDYPHWDTLSIGEYTYPIKIRWFIDGEEYMEGHWWEEWEETHIDKGFKELEYVSASHREPDKERGSWGRDTYTTVDEQYYDTDYATKMLSQEPIKQREEALTRKRLGIYWDDLRFSTDEFAPTLVKVSDLQKISDLRMEADALEDYLIKSYRDSLPDNLLHFENMNNPLTVEQIKVLNNMKVKEKVDG